MSPHCARRSSGLHESDMGALIEALPAELRPRLVELLGIDFDFTALTEVDDAVREEILDELPPRAVAEGVRELESDDAVAILEDLPKDEQTEILEQLPASERSALTRGLEYPEDSAGRRMQTEFIAAPATWNVGQAIDYMRETVESAGALLRALRRGRGRALHRRRAARPAVAQQAAGADRRSDGGRPSARARRSGPGRSGAPVPALQLGGRRRSSTATIGWSASSPSTTSPT